MLDGLIAYFYAVVHLNIKLILEKYFLNKERTYIISKQIGSMLKFERMRQHITIANIADAV